MAKIDIKDLGIDGVSDEVLALAERIADDSGELGKRWARVAALRAQGLADDSPEVRVALDDARVQSVLLVQRLDLEIRGLVDDAVRVWLPKLIVTLLTAAISAA